MVLLACAAGLVSCGESDDQELPAESADPPAKPAPGWRTIENAQAGFTVSVPRSWRAGTRRTATLVRSRDRLVAITIAADRSRAGRETPPRDYAREVITSLPDFEGSLATGTRQVARARYPSARIAASGSFTRSGRSQRIEVAALHRPGLVTYSAVIFRNARARPDVGAATVTRLLASLRARPPGADAQRSGRSG